MCSVYIPFAQSFVSLTFLINYILVIDYGKHCGHRYSVKLLPFYFLLWRVQKIFHLSCNNVTKYNSITFLPIVICKPVFLHHDSSTADESLTKSYSSLKNHWSFAVSPKIFTFRYAFEYFSTIIQHLTCNMFQIGYDSL